MYHIFSFLLVFALLPPGHFDFRKELLLCGINNYNNVCDDSDENSRYLIWHYVHQTYFESLRHNFGNNQTESTCGYVALAILLRYYDIYENDSIVSYDYEVASSTTYGSAGTYYEPYNSSLPPNSNNVPGYYDHLRYYSDVSLHSYLILKHKNALYLNPPDNSMSSTFMEEFGTNESILASLVISYLQERFINQYCNVVYRTSYNSLYTNDQIINYIIAEINNGRPVLYGFDGHARIVYGYAISNNGTVHFALHEGYDDSLTSHERINKTHIAPNQYTPYDPYDYPVGYLSLQFCF